MRRILLACLMAIFGGGCTASLVGARWSSQTTAIGRVSIGDTQEGVLRKMGQPQHTSVQRLTENGHNQVEWYYDTARESDASLSGRVRPLSKEPLGIEGESSHSSSGGTEYVVSFEDGKVVSVFEKPR